jgi:hypothetical protein
MKDPITTVLACFGAATLVCFALGLPINCPKEEPAYLDDICYQTPEDERCEEYLK